MSDDILIKEVLKKNKARYGAKITDGEAFEIFTAESILKRFGLTFDQIAAGIVDGPNDGGIDSAYFFVNRSIVAPDIRNPLIVNGLQTSHEIYRFFSDKKKDDQERCV